MKHSLLIMLLGALIALSSCYPGDTVTTSELDLVLTHHKSDVDFTQNRTYIMPNAILVSSSDDDHSISPADEAAILANIESNLTSLGYERLPLADSLTVDLIIFPEVIIVDHVQAGGCWGCYYNPWYPGWGGYYPPYPPSYVITYSTGTILISMINPDSLAENFPVANAIWIGAIDGLVRSGVTADYINRHIDQAFLQSPYLQVN